MATAETPNTPIGKLLKTITDFLADNKTTLTNLVLTGITVGLNVLLNSELFDCPVEKSTTYGYLFLFAPFIILIFANMLVIVVDWNPLDMCSKAQAYENARRRCFKTTIPSVTRVFVAPVVWLIVSFAETDYYVCGKVGAGPDKMKNLTADKLEALNDTMKNLTADEIEALKDLIAKTKTESQIIAWALFIGMVCVTFLVICFKNVCGGKSDGCQVGPENPALGMQNGCIPNEAIKASSELDDKHSASKARLNSLEAWVLKKEDTKPWLQVNLGSPMEITKIATQGGYVGGVARYVTNYILMFSDDGENFQEYKKDDKLKVFGGNSDGDTVNTNCFCAYAQYCRLLPRTWNEQFALRLELFGKPSENQNNGSQKSG